ncbi:hypothetical protein F5Y12DRAFT_734326 [Xylaria sp. FL1777]|nr:hypothetical protein F5Y12DRAFT_734326 [Xylaria sp. FL1777]
MRRLIWGDGNVTGSSHSRANAGFVIYHLLYVGLECIEFIAQLCLLNPAPRKQQQFRQKPYVSTSLFFVYNLCVYLYVHRNMPILSNSSYAVQVTVFFSFVVGFGHDTNAG